MDKVLRDGIEKFLDHAIELREVAPEAFAELLDDYLITMALEAEPDAAQV